MVGNFGILSPIFYRGLGGLQDGWKKFGDFFETFPPEGATCFDRDIFKKFVTF